MRSTCNVADDTLNVRGDPPEVDEARSETTSPLFRDKIELLLRPSKKPFVPYILWAVRVGFGVGGCPLIAMLK